MVYNWLIFREIFRMYIVVTHFRTRIQNLISELKPAPKLFLYQFLLIVSTIVSINFVIVFILSPVPLVIFVFLDVCNSYNRSDVEDVRCSIRNIK